MPIFMYTNSPRWYHFFIMSLTILSMPKETMAVGTRDPQRTAAMIIFTIIALILIAAGVYYWFWMRPVSTPQAQTPEQAEQTTTVPVTVKTETVIGQSSLYGVVERVQGDTITVKELPLPTPEGGIATSIPEGSYSFKITDATTVNMFTKQADGTLKTQSGELNLIKAGYYVLIPPTERSSSQPILIPSISYGSEKPF